MPRKFKFAQYLLAVEGMALMRSWSNGKAEIATRRIEEMIRICNSLDQPPQSFEIKRYEVAPREGYTLWSSLYDQDSATDFFTMLEKPILLRLLTAIPPCTALDVACGTGRQTELLVNLGHTVTGVDLTAEMLQHARKRVPQAHFLLGDLHALPLKDSSFDLAICSLALTHTPDLTQSIKEIARVVRRGGQIILSDLHPVQVAFGGDASFALHPHEFVLVHNYVHLHSEYLRAFAQCGLAVRECIEPLFTPQIANRLWTAPYIPEANSFAFAGSPALLMWDLCKQV